MCPLGCAFKRVADLLGKGECGVQLLIYIWPAVSYYTSEALFLTCKLALVISTPLGCEVRDCLGGEEQIISDRTVCNEVLTDVIIFNTEWLRTQSVKAWV